MRGITLIILLSVAFTARSQPVPELFWVSDGSNNRDLTLSPDGMTLLTTRLLPRNRRGVILISRKQDDGWSALQIAPFSGTYSDIEPMFSPDGSRLWFASMRPRPGRAGEDWDIWYADFDSGSGTFGTPVNAGPPVNSTGNEFYPSVSITGAIYFTSDREGGLGSEDIYRYDPAGQAGAVNLGPGVNSPEDEFNAFVAPDESYLLFSVFGREDDLGRGDIYASAGDGQGNFQAAVHLDGPVNSDQLDYCPFVFGNTLYFTSERSVLPERYPNLSELDAWLGRPGNGFGDIYSISLDNLLP